MDSDVTHPRDAGSIASAENGEHAFPLDWALGGVAGLSEANMRLALRLGDGLRAAWERLSQIGEKAFIECGAEGSAMLRRAANTGGSDGEDDVRPGRWEDIIADIEEWRLEAAEGLVAAWQDWQRAWAGGGTMARPAEERGELVLTPWPVVLTEKADAQRPDSVAPG
ncbi:MULTISPECIES: hypothetical protein [Sphingomonadaceae]|uniref:hypothetical protein n=1 Tax=Sphingomonadales TaxID=204457 RepID=UPI00076FEFBC|nr:hypothetical protein [Sphingobium sp. TKS]AMK22980.1 hypothetical protein K426_10185 [Sphingobium sp. TKS]MCF8706717.1 hypothetical protein [Rhizorhapis sp. SPR117]